MRKLVLTAAMVAAAIGVGAPAAWASPGADTACPRLVSAALTGGSGALGGIDHAVTQLQCGS